MADVMMVNGTFKEWTDEALKDVVTKHFYLSGQDVDSVVSDIKELLENKYGAKLKNTTDRTMSIDDYKMTIGGN